MKMNTHKTDIGNTQNDEIGAGELTNADLDGVSGGLRNNETAAWQAFMNGMLKGAIEGGAKVSCWME
jgi:hypothetical protein